jgi:hypothetical protein
MGRPWRSSGRATPGHQFIAFQSHSSRPAEADANGARIATRRAGEVIFETGRGTVEEQVHSRVNGAIARPGELRNPGAPPRGIGADEVIAAASVGETRLVARHARQAHANPNKDRSGRSELRDLPDASRQVQDSGGSLTPMGLEVDGRD